MCETHSIIYHSLNVRYHEILKNFMIFRLHFAFSRILKSLKHVSLSCFQDKMFEISFDFVDKVSNLAK
jgi:hypothetical protein